MKTLQIVTKAQANKILVESLFKAVNGKTLSTEKFDNGKYRPDVSLLGREIQAPDDVYAVYQVSRSDSDGKYRALMCVSAI